MLAKYPKFSMFATDIWILETSDLLLPSDEKYRWMKILSLTWKLWKFPKAGGQTLMLPDKLTHLNSQLFLNDSTVI